MRAVVIFTIALIAIPAGAAELRLPLPDLVGNYELSTFQTQSPSDPPSKRTTSVQTNISVYDVRGLRVELTGSILSGAAAGDGVFRQPVATPLRGSFAPSFRLPDFGLSWLTVSPQPDGAYSEIYVFPGSFAFPFGPDVVNFDPLLTLSLSPSTLSFTDINYIDVPSGGIALPDVRGIIITTPMRGEITSAYLVVQFVPEPTSLCSSIGAAMFLMCRRRRLIRQN